MATYSRTIEFTAESGVAKCVELPAPSRGTLDRLLIKQVSGTDAGFTYTLYDRKGACTNASDLHTLNGLVSGIADNGGKCRITTDAAHGLQVGDTIEVKNNSVSGHNVTHTVTAVPDEDVVDTDVNYGGANSGGRWQTTPEVYATNDSVMHEVMALVTVNGGGGGVSRNFAIERYYENQDNQSVTARRRATMLYLQITPTGTGNKDFQVAYTINPEVQ